MSEKQIKIRNAQIEDAGLLAEFNRNMAMETEHIDLIPEVILCGVNAVLENPARGFYVVAEVDGQLVASLMVTTEWSDWRNGQFWWIQSVYVVEQWRRQGLYRMLYEYVKQAANEDQNVCGFRLYVEKDNLIAQRTYDSVGMTETPYKIYEELKSGLRFHQADHSND